MLALMPRAAMPFELALWQAAALVSMNLALADARSHRRQRPSPLPLQTSTQHRLWQLHHAIRERVLRWQLSRKHRDNFHLEVLSHRRRSAAIVVVVVARSRRASPLCAASVLRPPNARRSAGAALAIAHVYPCACTREQGPWIM